MTTVDARDQKASTETWIRTIVLGFTLLNQILVTTNRSPLPWSEDEAYQYLSLSATIIVSAWTYWKNNSWTPPALRGDEVMKKLKAKEVLQNSDTY